MKGPRSSFLDKESAVVVCQEAFNLIQGIFFEEDLVTLIAFLQHEPTKYDSMEIG